MVGFVFHEWQILWCSFLSIGLSTSVYLLSPHAVCTVYWHRPHRHAALPAAVCKIIRSSLGAFAKLRNTTTSFFISVRLSVLMERLGSHWTDSYGNWYLRIISKICREKFKFHWNWTSIAGTSREDQYAFVIISRWILLRMRSASDQSCRENQNTHFMFSNILSKTVLFLR